MKSRNYDRAGRELKENHLVALNRPDMIDGVPMAVSVTYPRPNESDMLPDSRDRNPSLIIGNQFDDKKGVLVVRVTYRDQLCIIGIKTHIDPLITTLLESKGLYDPARHLAL